MLTIKRVPTVVSNYQEDDSNNSEGTREDKALGCGRSCLGMCCLPDCELHVYAFSNDKHEVEDKAVLPSKGGCPISFLNNLLLGEWEERMSRGLFRYDVTTCETKIIEGRYGFIAQLNEGRHLKKRPTEFRIDQVLQPFDKNKFNFTKMGQEVVLLRFEPNNGKKSLFFSSDAVDVGASSPNIVAINVSPIEYGHVLLIPRVSDCLPQRIDRESFSLALYFAKEVADPFFRVGYNSLGAFATINHLHFQAYYLSVPFPVEKASACRIMVKQGSNRTSLTVSELLNYPVRGLVFQGGGSLDNLSDAVARTCISLQKNNIPFNLLIVDCGQKVYLFPQCYAEKQAVGEVNQELLETQVNPAVWEISGHILRGERTTPMHLKDALGSFYLRFPCQRRSLKMSRLMFVKQANLKWKAAYFWRKMVSTNYARLVLHHICIAIVLFFNKSAYASRLCCSSINLPCLLCIRKRIWFKFLHKL